MRRLSAVPALASLLCVTCGFSDEKPLPATGRIQKAVVKTYGWSKRDLAQDIQITLARNIALADVVDMTVFGKLQPGSTHGDAARLMGTPTRVWTDNWGEPWHVYALPNAEVEVGCYYYTSGGTPSSCSWTLHAVPKVDPASLLLDPQLPAYLRQAVAAHSRVSIRSLDITTADGQQTVQVYIKSRIGPGVYWTDQHRSARRDGEPKGARRPTRG